MPSSQAPFRNPDALPESAPTPTPEPSVWRKYSAHHEFPLSALTSFVLHFLVVLLVALFGVWVIQWGSTTTDVELDTAILDVPGGYSLGSGGPDRGGDRDPKDGVVVLDSAVPDNFDVTSPVVRPPADPIVAPRSDKSLVDGARARSDGNRPGPGSGFGDGSERGPGTSKRKNSRGERMARWSVTFSYQTGEEYLQKLANLGATLAIAQADGKFLVINDVNQRPITTTSKNREELLKLNQLYWRQDDSDAMQALQRMLGLSTPPKFIWTFFPRDLEAALVDAEKKKSKLTEEQLNAGNWKTTFTAEKSGGKWAVNVVEQTKGK